MPLDAYTFLRDFAGPIAALIAASTAAVITFVFNRSQTRIARSQRDIALDRLKFDLFEKRSAIYLAAKELIEHSTRTRTMKETDPDRVRSLYVTLDEARFFFPREQRAILNNLHTAAETFFNHLGEREVMDQNDSVKWGKMADQLAHDSSALRAIYATLPEKFESALAFKQLTDPH